MAGLVPISATAPSAWASYIINGDGSDLEPDEADAAECFMDWLCGRGTQCGTIVSCEPTGFMWNHDAERAALASGLEPIGGAECEIYTALVPRESVQ